MFMMRGERNMANEVDVHIQDDDRSISIIVTEQKQQEVFYRLIAWCKKHGAWSGEHIMQSDDPQIDAAPFLSDLVDEVLRPDVKWDD